MAIKFFMGLRPLARRGALRDAVAGVSMAAMSIPQLLGYARIAGMPAVTGLYTGFLPLIAFALFGSSKHLVVAADSATATILAGQLSKMAAPGSAEYMALAGAVALIVAAMLIAARIFKLGFLADFLSRTVLVGFLAGVGVQVGVAMLGDMSGIAAGAPHTVEQIRQLAAGVHAMHWPTLELSVAVTALLLLLRWWKPGWPVSLVVVVAGIAGGKLFDMAARGFAVIGPVAGGLPPLALPIIGWSQMLELLGIAIACLAVIVAQSAAASRAFAERHGERVDENADLLGLAAANAAAAVSGAFVVNGSLTQTALGERAGARSQVAQLVSAALMLGVLLYLDRFLSFLPRCVLASVVFTIALDLINVRELRGILKESPGEFALALTTAAAVLLIGVENGILLALALSLLRHVRQSYRPHTMVLMANTPNGGWLAQPASPGLRTEPGLILYRFGADLFYANDHRFADEVRMLVERAPEPVRSFVIDAGAITAIDYSASRTIGELLDWLAQRGVRVYFGRVNSYLRADMNRHRLTPGLAEARIFDNLHEALAAARQPA